MINCSNCALLSCQFSPSMLCDVYSHTAQSQHVCTVHTHTHTCKHTDVQTHTHIYAHMPGLKSLQGSLKMYVSSIYMHVSNVHTPGTRTHTRYTESGQLCAEVKLARFRSRLVNLISGLRALAVLKATRSGLRVRALTHYGLTLCLTSKRNFLD